MHLDGAIFLVSAAAELPPPMVDGLADLFRKSGSPPALNFTDAGAVMAATIAQAVGIEAAHTAGALELREVHCQTAGGIYSLKPSEIPQVPHLHGWVAASFAEGLGLALKIGAGMLDLAGDVPAFMTAEVIDDGARIFGATLLFQRGAGLIKVHYGPAVPENMSLLISRTMSGAALYRIGRLAAAGPREEPTGEDEGEDVAAVEAIPTSDAAPAHRVLH